MMKTVGASLAFLASMLLLVAVATAAETKAPSMVRYKKVTGSVVSVNQTAIVVKSKVKGDVTLALTGKTDRVGGTAKVGDRVRVNYRQDEKGMTATKVEVLAAAAGTKQASAPPSAKPAPKEAAKTAK